MKKKILPIIALVFAFIVLLTNSTNVAVAENGEKCLKIYGSATSALTPDQAEICAEIETLDMDKVKSKDDNFEIFQSIIDVLGEEKENLTLKNFTSYASFDYANGKTLLGYYSITNFALKLDDVSSVQSYVDLLTENGATVKNINYSLSNYDEEYNKTLLLAVENAKEKASALGGDSLEIKEIKEENSYSSNYLYRTYFEGSLGFDVTGEIVVCAKVVVEFK